MREALLSLLHALLRQTLLLGVLLLGYLLQVCVMPSFPIAGVTPNLIFAFIAIITVGYGKLRALWAGAFYGIVLETMMPTVNLLNLALYPIVSLFTSAFFSDRSETQLEYERSQGRPGRNWNPYLRTPLCCMVCVLIYEIVNIAYIYLGGNLPTPEMLGRAAVNILYSSGLSLLLAWPVRRILGFRKLTDENPAAMRFGYQEQYQEQYGRVPQTQAAAPYGKEAFYGPFSEQEPSE